MTENSDMVISPYAYAFNQHYKHRKVVWVPYSSAIEDCSDHQQITYNSTPKAKILLTGNIRFEYPLREYVARLDHHDIEMVPHPGYGQHGRASQAVVRSRYYRMLNEYLCCFTDASIFRYILLKNFEIASVGSLLLTDKAIEREMNELGFVDFETCIFCEESTFLDRLSWILDTRNRETVDSIRLAGMLLVRQRHLTRHRAAAIANLMEEHAKDRGGRAPETPSGA
jgi:hypothetical protein